MEQVIAHRINIVSHKYSNDPNFKRKPLSFEFCKKCSRSGHSISTWPDKKYTKQLRNPNFQKQIFNQAMKANQNLPDKQANSNSLTGKPLPFPSRSRRNSRDNLDSSRHRIWNKLSHPNPKLYYCNNNFKFWRRNGLPYPISFNYQNKSNYNKNNSYWNISRPQSGHYNRDGNRPRRPFSLIDSAMYEITFTHFLTKNKQTTQCQIHRIQKHKTSHRNNFWNNNSMIYFYN